MQIIKTGLEDLADSPIATQLRGGFRLLRFQDELEWEFRQAHLLGGRANIRLNLLLAIVLIVAFAIMDRLLLEDTTQSVPDLLRFAVMVPLIGILLLVCHSEVYTRWFPPLAQIVAPLAGICVVLIESRAAYAGVELVFATLVITTMYVYLLVGMLFYAALRTNLIILAVYVGTALYSELQAVEALYSSLVLALANMVGAVACYNLETANRTSFLEARLLGEMAARDGLTGIHNRRTFDERIEQLWNQAVREPVPLAMLLIDIDCFKAFNDRYGHQAGDEALRAVAGVLSRFARRPLDLTARYGGEEFVIVLYDGNSAYATDLAHRLRAALEALNIAHDQSTAGPVLTVSIGVGCVQPTSSRSHQGLIQLADEALYAAKNQGRNRVVVLEAEYAKLKTGAFQA